MPSPIPRQDRWDRSLVLSHRLRPSPYLRRVSSCVVVFEACSAFTFITACLLAKPPKSGPLHQRLQQLRYLHCCSDCYRVERTSSRAGLSPLWISAFSRRTQVSQQCNRTGPPHSEETRVAGEGVWFLSDRMADPTGNRNSTHDSEGPSEMVGKRGCGGPRSLHRLAVRPRCLNRIRQLCSDTNRFSKNFATKPGLLSTRNR